MECDEEKDLFRMLSARITKKLRPWLSGGNVKIILWMIFIILFLFAGLSLRLNNDEGTLCIPSYNYSDSLLTQDSYLDPPIKSIQSQSSGKIFWI